MQKLFQLSSKELNPALTIHLQANEYTICPLWRQLGKCKYLNLPKSQQKKNRIRGDSYGESGDALFLCVPATGTRFTCACPHIVLFALYVFYNTCKILCFTTIFVYVSWCWYLLLCSFCPFCGDLTSDTDHPHFRKVFCTSENGEAHVLQTPDSSNTAIFNTLKLFHLTTCIFVNCLWKTKVTERSSVLIPHNDVNLSEIHSISPARNNEVCWILSFVLRKVRQISLLPCPSAK